MNRRSFITTASLSILGLSGCLSPSRENFDIVISSYRQIQNSISSIEEDHSDLMSELNEENYTLANTNLIDIQQSYSTITQNLTQIEENYTEMKNSGEDLTVIESIISILNRAVDELSNFITTIRQSIEYRVSNQIESASLARSDASRYYNRFKGEIKLLPDPSSVQSSYTRRFA